MIQDLKLDSQRWRAEKDGDQRGHGSGGSSLSRKTPDSRQPDASLVAYSESRTHASRQHYGPSEGTHVAPSSARSTHSSHSSSYAASESPHYTTTPSPAYTTHQPYGQPPPTHATHTAPRTDPYANYGQPAPAVAVDYRGYPAATPAYSYAPQAAQDPYGRPTATPHYAPQQPRYFGEFGQQFWVYR
jgi:hypothetical protein